VMAQVAPEIISVYARLCQEAGFEDAPGAPEINGSVSRRQLDLDALSHRIFLKRWRWLVENHTPEGARLAVVSKGDDELLALHNREAWHFPRAESGAYAGCYPADSAEAIAHLEALRAGGAEYLAIPSPSLWWLDHYGEFRQHLESSFRFVGTRTEAGLIFRLTSP
jgi:hypothetical protein